MLMEIIPLEDGTENGPDTLNEVINTDVIKPYCVCVCASLNFKCQFLLKTPSNQNWMAFSRCLLALKSYIC